MDCGRKEEKRGSFKVRKESSDDMSAQTPVGWLVMRSQRSMARSHVAAALVSILSEISPNDIKYLLRAKDNQMASTSLMANARLASDLGPILVSHHHININIPIWLLNPVLHPANP